MAKVSCICCCPVSFPYIQHGSAVLQETEAWAGEGGGGVGGGSRRGMGYPRPPELVSFFVDSFL